ncbi:hypothetical protein [Runella aurantiaca]|uniref:HNH domain-containing protein n=1 Tax=Runella aurantiaca TaxID=2282308 RepID=A0A369IC01_9BACT|nr:hypothetical protein [Runella aurantiaca]RDB06400.1 hypothetical protein DVG78_09085 [Runella aurantiaca]
MINFVKTDEAPACLAIEKAKPKSENYRCKDVVKQVSDDFFDKCYLCEDKHVKDINVEHFEPHRGNRDKMFDWKNLFFACSYCNNIKLGDEAPLLNCTDASLRLVNIIKLEIDTSRLPDRHFFITPLIHDQPTLNTALLLHKIYNGKEKPTPLKERGALNLRKRIVGHLSEFNDLIEEYRLGVLSKERMKKKIINELRIDSAFTAFKVWLVRDEAELFQEFAEYLPQ